MTEIYERTQAAISKYKPLTETKFEVPLNCLYDIDGLVYEVYTVLNRKGIGVHMLCSVRDAVHEKVSTFGFYPSSRINPATNKTFLLCKSPDILFGKKIIQSFAHPEHMYLRLVDEGEFTDKHKKFFHRLMPVKVDYSIFQNKFTHFCQEKDQMLDFLTMSEIDTFLNGDASDTFEFPVEVVHWYDKILMAYLFTLEHCDYDHYVTSEKTCENDHCYVTQNCTSVFHRLFPRTQSCQVAGLAAPSHCDITNISTHTPQTSGDISLDCQSTDTYADLVKALLGFLGKQQKDA